MKTILFRWFFLLLLAKLVLPIKCPIGWGQRGYKYSNGISWSRNCPAARYCFEAVTDEVRKVDKLIDYSWDSYYKTFYIRGCGGEFGTPLNIHPYKGNPWYFRYKIGWVQINITTEQTVTGHGGTEEMDLGYICRKDMCNGVSRSFSMGWISLVATVLGTAYFLL